MDMNIENQRDRFSAEDYRDARKKWEQLNVAYVLLSVLHDDLPPTMHEQLDRWLGAMEEVKAGARSCNGILAPDDADLLGGWLNNICRDVNTAPLYPH